MNFVFFFVSAGYPLVPKTISELRLVNEEMHEDCYESYMTNTEGTQPSHVPILIYKCNSLALFLIYAVIKYTDVLGRC